MLVASSFIRSVHYRGSAPVDTRLGFGRTLRLWCGEFVSNLIGFNWNAIVGPGSRANRVSEPAGDTPVLFVHGYICNAGFWRRIIRQLSGSGRGNLFTINLEPLNASMDQLAKQLTARIDEVLEATGVDGLVLVAHSMGGLVSRRALENTRLASKVRCLITLGTPHHGSVLANTAVGEIGRQMLPGSDWLMALNTRMSRLPVPIISIYSYHDNIVAPQTSPCLPGARNIALSGVGHQEMYLLTRVRNLLARTIEDCLGNAGQQKDQSAS